MKHDKATDPEAVGQCSRCKRRKVSYVDRKAARRASKRLHPSEKLHAYPCGDYWHIGHDEEWRKVGAIPRDNLMHEPLPAPVRRQIAAIAQKVRT